MTKEQKHKLNKILYFSDVHPADVEFICNIIYDLEQENKQLKENLRISQNNEETYLLEMQEITKILGLDEHTLFDDVKYYAKQLKEEIKKYINSNDFVYDELYKKREKIEKILGDKE